MEEPRLHSGEVSGFPSEEGFSAESDENKTGGEGFNKNMLRCFLLLLPIAIPVVVYLRDVDATRKIFLATFILFILVIFSCLLMVLIRSRKRNMEESVSDSDIARELSQRHLIAVTNRLLPRTLPHNTVRRSASATGAYFGTSLPASSRSHQSHLSARYHLPSSGFRFGSRSPSPHRGLSSVSMLMQHHQSHFYNHHHQQYLAVPSLSEYIEECENSAIKDDDPPPYEEALHCPLAKVHQPQPHTCCRTLAVGLSDQCSVATPPETPPPTYERVVVVS